MSESGGSDTEGDSMCVPSTSTSSVPSPKPCRICLAVSIGCHFGAEVCRACAAFYRRAIRSGRPFVCRQGGNACMKEDPTYVHCKKCRMDRCVAAGMRRELVQKRRKPSSRRSRIAVEYDLPDVEEVKPIIKELREDPKFLHSFLLSYREMTKRRICSEMAVLNIEKETEEQIMCTSQQLNEIMDSSFPIVVDFAKTQIPALNLLSTSQQDRLFKHFSMSLFYHEAQVGTAKRYSLTDRKRSLSLLTCLSMDTPNIVIPPQLRGNGMIERSVEDRSTRPQFMNILRTLKLMKLDDLEHAAAVALLLSAHEWARLPDAVGDVCLPIRQLVLRDLYSHHRQTRSPSDSCVRIGELLCLLVEVNAVAEIQKNELHLFSILFKNDDRNQFMISLVEDAPDEDPDVTMI